MERLEEYSAGHPETFDELGNWPADRFERCWHAFLERSILERLDDDRRSLVSAMYANGMMGGADLKKAVEDIYDVVDKQKREVLAKLRGETAAPDLEDSYWWEKPDASDVPGEDHR